jgi:hypothetical protein
MNNILDLAILYYARNSSTNKMTITFSKTVLRGVNYDKSLT